MCTDHRSAAVKLKARPNELRNRVSIKTDFVWRVMSSIPYSHPHNGLRMHVHARTVYYVDYVYVNGAGPPAPILLVINANINIAAR